MRDGSTRGRHTNTSPTDQRVVHLACWRDDDRIEDLRALALSARGLTWSRALFEALLQELHISDDFDALVGRAPHPSSSQYPRLIAVALLLRHSWCPEDLERTATRLGLLPATSTPSHTTTRIRRPQGRVGTERKSAC
jgi:hypothetical protein